MTDLNQDFVSQESLISVVHKTAMCLAGMGLGAWFIVSPEFWVSGQAISRLGAQSVGVFTVLVFGYIVFKTLSESTLDKKAALRIDNHGLYAKSLSHTAIPWDEIKTIQNQGSTAILQLKKDPSGKFDRERVYSTQEKIWSDKNIIPLSLIGYAHNPAEIWKDLEERFARYNEV